MPSEQVSTFNAVDTFAWKINFTIKIPTSSDSGMVLISRSPLSGLSFTSKYYGVGQYPSSGIKVARKFYKGTNLISFSIHSLDANTTYYLAAVTFNNNTNGVFYNLTNPKTIVVKTKGKTIGNYYKNLDTNKAVFLSGLTQLLYNHEMSPTWYSDFRDVVTEVYERDTFQGGLEKKYVVCDYSGIQAIYTGSFSFSTTGFNREHTLPKNWINFVQPPIPNSDLVQHKEGADWHNLTLTDGAVNSQRSDFVYKVPKTASFMGAAKYYENKSNYNDTNNCFEPQNSYKGNGSRCMLYMVLCYNGTQSKNWGFRRDLLSHGKNQNIELLKSWARTDTVDNFEIARHEYIASVQKSRNPFIDFPDWIDCIDFSDIHILKTCEGLVVSNPVVNISESKSNLWDIWYYPYSDSRYILKMYNDKIELGYLTIYNLNGAIVWTEKLAINEGENSFWISTENLTKGNYIIQLETEKKQKSMKFVF